MLDAKGNIKKRVIEGASTLEAVRLFAKSLIINTYVKNEISNGKPHTKQFDDAPDDSEAARFRKEELRALHGMLCIQLMSNLVMLDDCGILITRSIYINMLFFMVGS